MKKRRVAVSQRYVNPLLRTMECSVMILIIKSGLSIVYVEGSQVMISKKCFISFVKD